MLNLPTTIGKPTHLVDRPITHWFEAQVAHTPDHPAVVADDQALTYQQLNERANQLGHYLQAHGVEPEIRVGICLERSVDMIVALLGILKAGGVYVPLDPKYPAERLQFMLQDSQAQLLITHSQLLLHVSTLPAQVVRLDQDWAKIAQHRTTTPVVEIHPDHLAYIIYTSGSTGTPKGVMTTQRALTNYTHAAVEHYALQPSDRALQFASISFDASAEEIYPTLVAGATLRLRNDALLDSPAKFWATCAAWELTVLNLPTAYWHIVSQDISSTTVPPHVRLVIIGGERALPERVQHWLQQVDTRVRLVNTYGPTEATIVATQGTLTPRSADECTVTLGRAVANTQVYLLDQRGQMVPPGVVGEMYLGGAGLARGYLKRPDLTAEKFVPNPFSAGDPGVSSGSRLYRTGDLARYDADGQLEFMGRSDDQVKVRGFRIELGEIEAVLRQHLAVRDAIVMLHVSTNTVQHLVGYIVLSPEHTDTQALHSFLRERLPEYMVPAAFVILDDLPLTATGKVDRQALAAASPRLLQSDEPFVEPRTTVETLLMQNWADVFGLTQVSVDKSFFALGGHSLAAAQILARIRNQFSLDLSMIDLFARPTIAQLAELIETDQSKPQNMPLQVIRCTSRDIQIPLSFSQERVWFLSQLSPDNVAYNAYVTIHFKGRLQVPVLEQALTEIVRRHEILRTSFEPIEGGCAQKIHPPQPVTVSVIDLSAMTEGQRAVEAERLIFEECEKSFDVSCLPLVRWTLLRLAAEEHILIQVEHHFIHDGWSLAKLLHEIKVLYTAFAMGMPSPLPELAIQYADFVVWQRAWMQGAIAQGQLDYWKQKLMGLPPILEFPADHARPKEQSFKGWRQNPVIPGDLGASLRALSCQEGVTLFMVMLSAFKVLMYRYTQQEDLVVGTAVANRRLREAEDVIGMIVNNIILRTTVTGQMTFRELLARVRDVTLEAYAHQDIPFEKVVEALRPERQLRYNPLFQIMFSFHDSTIPELDLPEVVGNIVYPHNGSAKFDLNIVVMPDTKSQIGQNGQVDEVEIRTEWEYNTDLFDHQTITRMIDQYGVLLESIVANPDQLVATLPLLTEERQEILVQFNDTARAYPDDQCLHDLLAAQAARQPAAIAVTVAAQQLTYRELDQQANQLAHVLQAHGVGPEVRVGVCLERSLELVISLLAILKAGGGYVPLDPAYPAERLQFLLQDAQPAVVLTQTTVRAVLPPDVAVIVLDQATALLAEQPTSPPASRVGPDNLAYIIYTSGSTGTPKGAMLSHRAIVNRLLWMQDVGLIDATDRVMQKTPFSFDVSVWELFAPLVTGATLVIAKPGGHQDSDYLMELIQQQQITSLHFVPPMLQVFLDTPGITECTSLRRVLCSGDTLPFDLQQRFFTRIDVALHNMYGPTETAVEVSWWACQRNSSRPVVPIGGPIANTTFYVLDRQMEPVPIGVPGELYIGGVQLARGYHARPALTAEKFVPSPFSEVAGARLYRSGDLVRWLSGGTIEFIGRIDFQVKVRGFRIELGEIESVLTQIAGVREAVVVVREDTPNDKRLVSYLVPEATSTLPIETLRQECSVHLPEYMIPSAFVLLDEMPLTANGKINRALLPAPDLNRYLPDTTFVAPRTPVEEQVAAIWAEILGLEQIGIHDNFFALGGHSLLATQVISRLRADFQIELPLRRMFEMPTVTGLSEALLQDREQGHNVIAIARLLRELGDLSEEEVDSLLDAETVVTDEDYIDE